MDHAAGIFRHNTVISNGASLDGGGIFLYSTPMTVSDNSFIANTANQNGGGVYLWDGPAVVTGNRVFSNIALNSGGGIYPWYGVNTIVNDQVANNQALNEGGGLFLDHSVQTVTGNLINANTAILGGGLYVHSVTGLFQANTGDFKHRQSRRRRYLFVPRTHDHQPQLLHRQQSQPEWWRSISVGWNRCRNRQSRAFQYGS